MAILLKVYVLLLTMLLVISVIDSQTTLPSQQTSVTEVTTQSAQQPEDPAPTESEIEKNTGLNFCFDFFSPISITLIDSLITVIYFSTSSAVI